LEEAGEGDFVDLDGGVPEGGEGSYEHTDTEVEDQSSEEGEGVVARGVEVRRVGPVMGTFDRRTGEVVSSPVGGRRGVVARGMVQGRMGREN